MLWIVLGTMCLLAVGFAVWPLVRAPAKSQGLALVSVLGVVALSVAIYWQEGSPDVPSGASEPATPDVGAMVASLAARLESQPDDLDGWKMLGRSQMTLNNHAEAVAAYERAVELSEARDVQSLVGLGEALLAAGGNTMNSRTIALFDNALALEPNNPTALFWGGIGAFNRGDAAQAAERWERLLGTNPPAEIRGIIEQRIAVWRGEAPPPPGRPPVPEDSGPVVTANISVADVARADLPVDATVFVIARDPRQPSPPIAVTRRLLSELPAEIGLGDGDSMIPGRELSGFAEFELVARVSLSGAPVQQPGDWFGRALVRPADNGTVSVAISEQVQ